MAMGSRWQPMAADGKIAHGFAGHACSMFSNDIGGRRNQTFWLGALKEGLQVSTVQSVQYSVQYMYRTVLLARG